MIRVRFNRVSRKLGFNQRTTDPLDTTRFRPPPQSGDQLSSILTGQTDNLTDQAVPTLERLRQGYGWIMIGDVHAHCVPRRFSNQIADRCRVRIGTPLQTDLAHLYRRITREAALPGSSR